MDIGAVHSRDKIGAMVQQNKLPAVKCQASQSITSETCPGWFSDVRRRLSHNTPDQKAVLTFLSRSLNLLTGGSPDEIFCSRAHRNEWRICPYIDRMFRMIRSDEKEHCRACYLEQERIRRRQRANG